MLTDAGFTEAAFHGWTGYVTSSCTQGGLVTARKPGSTPTAHGDREPHAVGRQAASTMTKSLSLTYGLLCYLIFLGTFLYAIGFVGNLAVPKSIDAEPAGSVAEAVGVNLLLLALFA